MNARAHKDHLRDPEAWARALGVSREAIELYAESEVIDLHIDSFIWWRVFGYDLLSRHDRALPFAAFLGQVDLPRIREARVGGGIWSITTNPLRGHLERGDVFSHNLDNLRAIFARAPEDVEIVRNAREYHAARAKGVHAALLGVQGGNALDRDLEAIELARDWIVRVTVVHLSTSTIGTTSSPLRLLRRKHEGLTSFGKSYIERLNAARIFVDLAHIDRRGFFDAAEVHDKTQPLIVTHTGIAGVHDHWRNLDDTQLATIADTGGTVGVMFQSSFLGDPLLGGRAETVVAHLAHIIDTVGEDYASLGSDFDGMIIPPRDLQSCLELPRLVDIMLRRKWTPERIQKILGGNFLRALALLRP